MKYKNYKSALHNFAHSFISIDYTNSQQLAVNALIALHNIGCESVATFDFIDKSILPTQAQTAENQQLLNDYTDWLPEHCYNHNCDPTAFEKLSITISTDFDNTQESEYNKNHKIFTLSAKILWKVANKNKQEQTVSVRVARHKKFIVLHNVALY